MGGFVEVRGTYQLGVSGVPWQLVERVRPRFEAPLGSDRVLLAATIEAGLHQGATTQQALQDVIADSAFQPLLDLAGCTWPEATNPWLGVDAASDYLAVDRLYVDWYHPKFDLRVGRQAMQWGSALIVNPTDPYPQVLATEPWKPRAGVNSARITVPIADVHQVQAVVGLDDTFERPRAAVRATANWLQTDWSAVGAYRSESDELLAGVDIKGTLGVGFWVEGALHFRELFDPDADLDLTHELAVGFDYSFPVLEQLVVMGQYYRNGAGATSPDDYDVSGRISDGVVGPECDTPLPLFDAGAAIEPDAFAPFFAGRDYGILSVLMGVTQDVSVSGAMLQNLNDGTGFGVPTVSVRPWRSLEVSLSGQIPYRLWGDGGEFSPRDDDLVLSAPGSKPPLELDLSGLLPDATLILWTRASF